MRTLSNISPSPEQLKLILNFKPGIVLVRGAAGSGKTTTAILRLKQLIGSWLSRRQRLGLRENVRVLVITFNRTLRGYVKTLVAEQIGDRSNLDVTVSTFGRWSTRLLSDLALCDVGEKNSYIQSLGAAIPLPDDFILNELDYLQGRFIPSELRKYLTCRREGRGAVPRMEMALRERILNEIAEPFNAWKRSRGEHDWNDLACSIADLASPPKYDIIVADESQDLTANQVRAILNCAADPSSVTFVLDAAQQIYPCGFAWREIGASILPSNSYRLATNHRNTVEICKFASPLLEGLNVGDDGTLPDFNSCSQRGAQPRVLKGQYLDQLKYAITYLSQEVDLTSESVAFLKPRGGKWFDTLKATLSNNSFDFVEITREADWPEGDENIALSTMYSAKGLEFDHVIILGLSDRVTPHGADPEDTDGLNLRRLLAMAITRARKSVLVGYKPSEASRLVAYFEPDTFEEIQL